MPAKIKVFGLTSLRPTSIANVRLNSLASLRLTSPKLCRSTRPIRFLWSVSRDSIRDTKIKQKLNFHPLYNLNKSCSTIKIHDMQANSTKCMQLSCTMALSTAATTLPTASTKPQTHGCSIMTQLHDNSGGSRASTLVTPTLYFTNCVIVGRSRRMWTNRVGSWVLKSRVHKNPTIMDMVIVICDLLSEFWARNVNYLLLAIIYILQKRTRLIAHL